MTLSLKPSRKKLKADLANLQEKYNNLKELYTLVKQGKDILRLDLRNAKSHVDELQAKLDLLTKERYKPLLDEIIPVLDNLWHSRICSSDVVGLMAIYNDFLARLEKFGLKIYKSLEKPFDPTAHEAIGLEITNDYPDNTVVNELVRGILLDGKIIRYAQVIVSKNIKEADQC